jgi:intracellular septation protein
MKSDEKKSNPHGKARFLCDFGPLFCFFVTYRLYGLQTATLGLIVATAVALGVMYLLERRVAIMPLVSGVAVAVFGGITLLLHDETFIKIKPTIINLLFSALLLGGVCAKKPMLKYLFGEALQMTQAGWMALSLRWGVFFIFLACLNEFIWRNYPTDFWVNFKVFGMFTCTIIFTLCQIPLIKRHWNGEPLS